QKIIAFQRPLNSGSQTMMLYFMGDTPLKEPLSYEVETGMGGVVENVAQYTNEKGAMGYSFRYFVEELQSENSVKLLKIDGIAPTLENIENGTYPLCVDLVCAKLKSNNKENVQKMLEFLLSDDGKYILRKTGYAPVKNTEITQIEE
ncbi:MAG: hypothetical protein IJR45_08655, partial [Firmicutes bacterium]|nr:hypothetical protein [Bacillota bacterium]